MDVSDVMMDVMVIGDSHGEIAMVRDALRVAEQRGAAAVISVGDFGIWPGSSGKMYLDTVASMSAQREVDVYVVPGNHDDYEQIDAAPLDDQGWHVLRPGVRAAPRPHVWTWQGVTFLAFGGAASIDGPGGTWDQIRGPVVGDVARRLGLRDGHALGAWWPRERITDDDVERAIAAIDTEGPIDVMVTHDAPAGVPLEGTAFPLGDEQRERIRTVVDHARPQSLICGHWHVFRQHRLGRTEVTVLSADINPDEPQYAWLNLAPARVGLEVPAPWDSRDALGRTRR